MEIKGNLSEFPLPELLQLLDRRHATGCLSLEIFSDYYSELRPQKYLIWLQQGHITNAQHEGSDSSIYSLAVHKEWIGSFVARKLQERAPQNTAAGLYLESQGVLNFEQLRLLFLHETVYRVETLCNVRKATFEFQSNTEMQMHKMTGFRIPAARVAEQGIQSHNCHDLKHWFVTQPSKTGRAGIPCSAYEARGNTFAFSR